MQYDGLAVRDEFPQVVRRVIAERASLICSNASCGTSTGGPQIDSSKSLNLGVAAHISAASQGGPRYDPTLTVEQRSSADNGVWLCQKCAKLVDNDEARYPASILKAWKVVREHEALNQIMNRLPASESARKAVGISQWKGQRVLLVKMASPQQELRMGTRPWAPIPVTILDCNEFYVKLKGDGWDNPRSVPMNRIEIGHDDKFNLPELLEY